MELNVEGNQFPGELLTINQLGGVQRDVPQTLEQMQKTDVKQYDNILARLRAVPRLVDQNIELLKRGIAAGITVPKIVLRDVPGLISAIIPDEPMKSGLLHSFADFPRDMPAADQERLRTEAVKIYTEQLLPAYQKLRAFVSDEYLPKARETIGYSALPNGKKWYAFNARQSTTTTMTPQELHDLGLREVARIRGEFVRFLHDDPQFYYAKPDELLTGYRDIAKRIDPELPKLFGKLPRLTYGVKPVPSYAEKSQPTAYYENGSARAGRPGYFFANTYNLSSRPKWEMECLTLHESVPGHHLQISIAQEMENVPEFRRYEGNTAYIEGWALYCESLGSEMGFYQDPYSHFGQLSYEMWRACRLVVDTGMHAFGWSRQKAIDYLCANAGKSPFEATVEIDRYIVWPGQALAYKVGQLKIRELRDNAARELGEKFDIRAFHDALLAHGALPLSILEATMKDWVNEQKNVLQKPASS